MKHEPKKHFDVSKPRRHAPDPTSKPIIVGHHPTMPDPMIREEGPKTPKPISVVSADDDEPQPLTVSQPDKPAPEEPKAPDLSDVSATAKDPSAPPVAVAGLHPGPEPLVHGQIGHTAPGAVFTPVASPVPENTSPIPEPPRPDVPVEPVTSVVPEPAVPTIQSPPTPTPQTPMPTAAASQSPTPPEPLMHDEVHIPAGHDVVVHHRPRIWVWIIVAAVVIAWFYGAADALTDVKLPYEFFKN